MGMMGESDAKKKEQLKDVLTHAWSAWTQGIDIDKAATTFPRDGAFDSSDGDSDEEEKSEGVKGRSALNRNIEGETLLKRDIFDIEEEEQGIGWTGSHIELLKLHSLFIYSFIGMKLSLVYFS